MSIQEMELDPNAVDGTTFNAHQHNYDKMTGCSKPSFCDPLTHTVTPTGTPV